VTVPAELTDAIVGLDDDQAPPDTEELSEMVAPTETVDGPVTTPGSASGFTDYVRVV
jgi:hypothetical protein